MLTSHGSDCRKTAIHHHTNTSSVEVQRFIWGAPSKVHARFASEVHAHFRLRCTHILAVCAARAAEAHSKRLRGTRVLAMCAARSAQT